MVLKSIAGVQVSGWVNTLPSPTPLGPLACATVGGKRRGERSIQMPLFVSQLSFQCSLRAGCSAMLPDLCPSSCSGKADGEGKAPWEEALPSKACYPFPSTYRFLQGADKDRHFAYSETGFSSFYPLLHRSLGFALFWDLSKKINTTSPNFQEQRGQPVTMSTQHTHIHSLSILQSGFTTQPAGLPATFG